MAQMFPKSLDCFPKIQKGERRVFDLLRALPADWAVIHSVSDIADQLFEADFVILIPERGILVLEVKDICTENLSVEDGRWKLRTEEQGWGSFPHTSPLLQAFLASKKISKKLFGDDYTRGIVELERNRKITYTSAAIMVQQASPLEGAKKEKIEAIKDCFAHYLWGYDSLLNRPEATLRGLFPDTFKDRWKNCTPQLVEDICDKLALSQYFKMSLSEYDLSMKEACRGLTDFLRLSEESRANVCVEGCAGSGKTYMAKEEALRLAKAADNRKEDLRILMLCFNRNLADKLKKELNKYKKIITVDTYDTYFGQWLPKGTAPRTDDGPDMLVEGLKANSAALEQLGDDQRFDHIFVDEAQDLSTARLNLVAKLRRVRKRPDGIFSCGRVYIFRDSNQNLFLQKMNKRAAADEEEIAELDFPMHVRLRRNLRNSHQIARYSHRILGDVPENLRPLSMTNYNGSEVYIHPGSDNVEERRQMAGTLIRELLEDSTRSILERHIVVLSPFKPENPESSLRGLPGKNSLRSWNGVKATTIRGFKGLEAQVVILTDICVPGATIKDGGNWALTENDFYVGCTRAKYELHIIPTVGGGKAVAELLEQAKGQVDDNAPD